ncbi:MAG TPA: multicopper oxidase domain-containing protein [Terriglobales bacterium]|nr:multicopper oxidase domain-containing protein [Terriglobales bacterium]
MLRSFSLAPQSGPRALLLISATIVAVAASCLAAVQPEPSVAANRNSKPAGRLERGVLVLALELREGQWSPEGGRAEPAPTFRINSFAEEGHSPQTPGPLIRVTEGTELHVSVHNLLPMRVTVHGLEQHPGNDDHALTVGPGETQEVRFNAGAPGSYIYWASTTAGDITQRRSTDGMMSGAFIVDALGASTDDHVFVIQLWTRNIFHQSFEGALSINGESWPATEHLNARVGKPEHWRVLNASLITHPMHLHGFFFRVDAVGSGERMQHYTPDERRMAVTEPVMAGHTFEMTWVPERAGNWIFHCHIFDHMTNFLSPYLYGPERSRVQQTHMAHEDAGSGMAKMVLGITVVEDHPHLTPANAVTSPVSARRHLIARERPASKYDPGGPGFYLEGTSNEINAVGPPLVITRGERTAITVTNELNEPTAVHWHGLEIESYYDGVPGWTGTTNHTTPAIPPGASFVAYMTPPRAGTFIYHTHWHNEAQLTGGMYGALLVMEPGQKFDPATDKVFVLGRGGPDDMRDPLLLNGSSQPGTMVLLLGRTYRLRLINMTPNDAEVETSLDLDGHPTKWRAVAKDGADLPPQQAMLQDALQPISVGETYEFEFLPKSPGRYELHFAASLGAVSQVILVVPPDAPISVFAK